MNLSALLACFLVDEVLSHFLYASEIQMKDFLAILSPIVVVNCRNILRTCTAIPSFSVYLLFRPCSLCQIERVVVQLVYVLMVIQV